MQNLNEECDALKKSLKKAADDFNVKQSEVQFDLFLMLACILMFEVTVEVIRAS